MVERTQMVSRERKLATRHCDEQYTRKRPEKYLPLPEK